MVFLVYITFSVLHCDIILPGCSLYWFNILILCGHTGFKGERLSNKEMAAGVTFPGFKA